MGIVSKETAYRIWTAHHQIETADKLLADIYKTIIEGGDPTPLDAYNRHRRGYSLGVPSGSGERILGVHPQLAGSVVMAHRADQERELVKASQDALTELIDAAAFAEVEPMPAPVQPPDPEPAPRHPDDPPEDLPF